MGGASNKDIHCSVLLEETVSLLGVVSGGVYMDGTLGLGGHTLEILRRSAPEEGLSHLNGTKKQSGKTRRWQRDILDD